jgi:DNA topoisomerase-1
MLEFGRALPRVRTTSERHLRGRELSVSQAAESPTARKRAITRVVQEVAEYLGNTPAVARASYIDSRAIARYEDGITIASSLADLGKGREFGDVATKGHAEQAPLRLLSSGRARV